MSKIKLTQYSHGAGCGCKISPAILDTILKSNGINSPDLYPNLLVGNDHRDDAAVMDLGNGTAVISTTDFFMPIVDDACLFGQIASVNAISDVYAMGGKPIMAIGILGWPIDQLSSEVAHQVMKGAHLACAEAKIPLAGGHSIDSPEPIFGLAVTGLVDLDHIKTNDRAQIGDVLYLTKPLGVGILSTAQKKGIINEKHAQMATDSMTALNKIGEQLGGLEGVHAMTDVTGFGLLGHLKEVCVASQVGAEIDFDRIPLLDKLALDHYISKSCVPGGTKRNWGSYGHMIGQISDYQRTVLCDPQTSGGLLISVNPSSTREVEDLLEKETPNFARFGVIRPVRSNAETIQLKG